MKTPVVLFRFLFFCSITLGPISSAASAQAVTPIGRPPEDFKQWADIAHHLEATPLDPQVNRDAEVAVRLLSASPDFHTPLCTSFFSFFNKLTADGYPYQAQVYRLYILSSAAYHIETGKTDAYGANLYAFTSVLKGYDTILKSLPNARAKALDELLVTDLSGRLPDMLRRDSTCRE